MDMTEIRRLEEQKVGTLRLSEAIRLGAKRGPQCKYVLHLNGATCALGAAAVGWGWIPNGDRDSPPPSYLRGLRFTKLWAKIAELNDRYDMTREEIADYVQAQGY